MHAGLGKVCIYLSSSSKFPPSWPRLLRERKPRYSANEIVFTLSFPNHPYSHAPLHNLIMFGYYMYVYCLCCVTNAVVAMSCPKLEKLHCRGGLLPQLGRGKSSARPWRGPVEGLSPQ